MEERVSLLHTCLRKKSAKMDVYDKVSELGKRRGIFFPSFEIYGGVSGFFDYGPIGLLLKRNIEDKWRQLFVYREGMVELESTVIMPEKVFEASGHLAHFSDAMTKCTQCGEAFRVDHLLNELGVKFSEGMRLAELDKLVKEENARCLECGGRLSNAEPFNMMFQTKIGSYKGGKIGYGRPEAGQGQFVDFKRIYTSERERLPLGIAQLGKCVRNEIAPRKGILRLREFTIIDYEIFFDPEDPGYPRISLIRDQKLQLLTVKDQLAGNNHMREITVDEALSKGLVMNEILCYFMAQAVKLLDELGIPKDKQRLREQLPEERAHYSEQTFDQEVWLDRWGWTEVSGHAYRTDYDLRNHMAHSGVDLRVYKTFNEPRKVTTVKITPITEQLVEDFGIEEAKRIEKLLLKSNPVIIKKELQNKGFYEVTGQPSTSIMPQHVKIQVKQVKEAGRYFVPHVIEPSFGIDRILYSVLEYAYSERKKRTSLQIPREIAPIKVGVFPLVNKEGLPAFAEKIYRLIVDEGFIVNYDESGSIGRRYARADEIGIPLCITIDYQSLENNTVTLRDISTWNQVRANIAELPKLLHGYFRKKIAFHELGHSFSNR